MRIAEFGNQFTSTEKINFLSNSTCLEYDLVILNFDAALNNFQATKEDGYSKRKANLEEFITHKKMPIVYITPTPRSLHFVKHQSAYPASYRSFAPVPQFDVELETGNKMKVVPKTALSDFLTKYENYFSYRSYVTSQPGTVIAETFYSGKSLGFYTDEAVFLPFLNSKIKEIEDEFFKDLYIALQNLISADNSIFPEWANRLYLPDEQQLQSQIRKINEDIAVLQDDLSKKLEHLSFFSQKKRLLTATGKELEAEVGNIFRDLGLELLETESNRDDLIVKYGDKIAVVEIKGVSGSAAEKHAAQLEKWSANYLERTGLLPKAILIVNPFREKPLTERTEKAYPDQMIKYSKQREHCLLTTVQLLGLYFAAALDSEKKDALICSLFDTVGVYEGFKDWQDFIQGT